MRFSVVIERDEDGYYIATVPSLPGCHTQAKNLDELMKRIKEAIELYLEVEKDIEDRKFVGV
jgi:predicted RNase H-like HicB family nuclease